MTDSVKRSACSLVRRFCWTTSPPIVHQEFRGIRVSPSVYTTLQELDRFCDAMEQVIQHGLPA